MYIHVPSITLPCLVSLMNVLCTCTYACTVHVLYMYYSTSIWSECVCSMLAFSVNEFVLGFCSTGSAMYMYMYVQYST